MTKKIVISAFLCITAIYSFADNIYLSNGRVIKGMVKSEDGSQTVLQVENGEIVVMKSDIVRVEATDEVFLKEKVYPVKETPPKYLRDALNLDSVFFTKECNKVEAERTKLVERRNAFIGENPKKEKLLKKFSDLSKESERITAELVATDQKKDPDKYNSLTGQLNELGAKMIYIAPEMSLTEIRVKDLWMEYNNSLKLYKQSLDRLYSLFMNIYNDREKTGVSDEHSVPLRSIKKRIDVLAKEFEKYEVPAENAFGNVLMIRAGVNNRMNGLFRFNPLIMDFVVSKDFYSKCAPAARSKTADGKNQIENAKSYIMLDSVSIEGVLKVNIPAIVVNKKFINNADGEFGRSFFADSIVEYGADRKRIILYEFTPL